MSLRDPSSHWQTSRLTAVQHNFEYSEETIPCETHQVINLRICRSSPAHTFRSRTCCTVHTCRRIRRHLPRHMGTKGWLACTSDVLSKTCLLQIPQKCYGRRPPQERSGPTLCDNLGSSSVEVQLSHFHGSERSICQANRQERRLPHEHVK